MCTYKCDDFIGSILVCIAEVVRLEVPMHRSCCYRRDQGSRHHRLIFSSFAYCFWPLTCRLTTMQQAALWDCQAITERQAET